MTTSIRQLLREKAGEIAATGFVPSPCVSVCRMDARSGLCEGCFRTLDEIAEWSGASDDEKRAIWGKLLKRAEDA